MQRPERRRQPRARTPSRSAIRRTATTSSAPWSRRRRTTWRAAVGNAVERGAALVGDVPRAHARRASSAPRICSRPNARRFSRSPCARPARRSSNAVAEVREAVDFLRYYAAQARAELDGARRDRRSGPVVAISPWNFPLAIFVGEVAAALAAGNPVLAKPAEQTPLIAHEAVRLLHRAGVPAQRAAAAAGTRRDRRRGARRRSARSRASSSPAPPRSRASSTGSSPRRDDDPVLIAETGGQNAMIVDSSALAGAGRRRRAVVGVRQRRPALLGAARAVPAGGRRARRCSRCSRARCASSPSAIRDGSRPTSAR